MYFAHVLEKYDDFVARPKLLAFWKIGNKCDENATKMRLQKCERKACKGVNANAVKLVRMQDQLFSPIDVTMLVAGKHCKYTAQRLRFLRERHPEVNEQIINAPELMQKPLT